MPEKLPVLDVPMEKLAGMSYQDLAYEVMSRFLTDYTEEELRGCIARLTMKNLIRRRLLL